MDNIPSILAFSGSTRSASLNDKLVRVAARSAENEGATVKVIQLREFEMPLYDADLESEQGLPDSARKLKKLMLSHQGFILASPEYNSSISAVLKNTIDWVSRREEGELPLECFKSKVVGLLSASPGGLGGLRGLVHIRAIMGSLGCLVIPEQMAVPAAHLAFDDHGQITDDSVRKRVEAVGTAVADILKKLHS